MAATLPATLAVVIALSCPLSAPAQVAAADRALLQSWLLSDCSVGEAGRLADAMRARGAALEQPLLDALRRGPDSVLSAAAEATAAARIAQMGRGLQANPAIEKLLRGVAPEEAAAQERVNFAIRYRAQAVAGLGLVGTAAAQEALGRLARDRDSPLRSAAAAALGRLPKRLP